MVIIIIISIPLPVWLKFLERWQAYFSATAGASEHDGPGGIPSSFMHPPSKSAGQSHLHPWHQRREPPQDSRSKSTRRASRSSRSGSDRSCKTPVGASVLIPTPPNRPPPSRPAVRRTPSPSTMSLDPSKNQGGGRPPQSQSPQRLPSVSRHRSRSPAARRRRRARNSSESPPRRTRARAQTRHETPVGAAPRQHQEAPVIQVLREQLQQEETPCQLQRAPRQQEIELLQTPTMPDLNAIMHAALSNGLPISLTLNPPTPRQQ